MADGRKARTLAADDELPLPQKKAQQEYAGCDDVDKIGRPELMPAANEDQHGGWPLTTTSTLNDKRVCGPSIESTRL